MTENSAQDELHRWRAMADVMLGVTTPDEVADYITLTGLSLKIGEYGEWGIYALEMLFAELGIKPDDDLKMAVESVRRHFGGAA